MKSSLLVVPLISSLLIASTPALKASPRPATSRIQMRRGLLGWSGIFLGDSHRVVETQLNRRVPITPYLDALACGSFQSTLDVHGHPITVQWSAADATATVESITVKPTSEEVAAGGQALADGLLRRLPSLKLLGSRTSGDPPTYTYLFSPKGGASHQLLLKVGAENIFFVSLEVCLD